MKELDELIEVLDASVNIQSLDPSNKSMINVFKHLKRRAEGIKLEEERERERIWEALYDHANSDKYIEIYSDKVHNIIFNSGSNDGQD